MARPFQQIAAAVVSVFAMAVLGCGVSAADPELERDSSQINPAAGSDTTPAKVATRVPAKPQLQPDSNQVLPKETSSPASTAPQAMATAATNSMFGPIECNPSIETVKLTHHIYPPDEFDSLVPMGRMWDSHVTPTDHLYVQLHGERVRGFVTMPAAGTIVSIQRFPNDQAPFWDNSLTEPDYRVVVAHSCTLFSVFIHLGELAPEIQQIVGVLEHGQYWFPGKGKTPHLEAGKQIAMLGGSAFDYSLHDGTAMLAGFQVPEHYEREPWKVHTVDPFDYMTNEVAGELMAKNERTVAPFGGRIDYDIPGTAAGNWFMDGTVDYSGSGEPGRTDYWNGHLSIAYDHIDPGQVRISIGRDIGLTYDDCHICGGVYAVNGNTPDPADVTSANGIVKYELTGRRHVSPDSVEKTESDGVVLGVFLVEVIDDSSIKAEFVKGVSAADVSEFTVNAVLYRR